MAKLKENIIVAVVMGSLSDKPIMAECTQHLDYFGIPFKEYIFSAHRTPDATAEFAKEAQDK